MNNITFHGGEEVSSNVEMSSSADSDKLNNLVKDNHKMNVLDKLISTDCVKNQ